MAARRSSARRERGAKLSEGVVEALRSQIAAGQWNRGDRLPTEQQMVEEFGVSRTVIREAIAGLHASGLVEPRHGIGVFVSDRPHGPNLRLLPDDLSKLSTVLEVLELRLAVEVESAFLAAQRRSPAQDMKIREAHAAMGLAIERDEPSEKVDFQFHKAVADATNNAFFGEFLTYLGSRVIPRAQLRAVPESERGDYLRRVQGEHARIVAAISQGDPETAQAEMRHHLTQSQRRYRGLLGEK